MSSDAQARPFQDLPATGHPLVLGVSLGRTSNDVSSPFSGPREPISLSAGTLDLRSNSHSFSSNGTYSLVRRDGHPYSVAAAGSPPTSTNLSAAKGTMARTSRFVHPNGLPFPTVHPQGVTSRFRHYMKDPGVQCDPALSVDVRTSLPSSLHGPHPAYYGCLTDSGMKQTDYAGSASKRSGPSLGASAFADASVFPYLGSSAVHLHSVTKILLSATATFAPHLLWCSTVHQTYSVLVTCAVPFLPRTGYLALQCEHSVPKHLFDATSVSFA